MDITPDSFDELNPDDDPPLVLEPLPPFIEENVYLQRVRALPMPTVTQVQDFVAFVADAKSWYKHLPATPPGSPLFFYLDPHAGQDRLRRWGHRVIYRDRTEHTDQLHYTWMTTADYRRRFGYLAFCSPHATSIWTDEWLGDGVATLDPNFLAPLVEEEAGRLSLVPEAVLNAGGLMVTRTLHPRTDARAVWRGWKRDQADRTAGEDVDDGPLSDHWMAIAGLCQELTEVGPGASARSKAIEAELDAHIARQRSDDHESMAHAIQSMLEFVFSGE